MCCEEGDMFKRGKRRHTVWVSNQAMCLSATLERECVHSASGIAVEVPSCGGLLLLGPFSTSTTLCWGRLWKNSSVVPCVYISWPPHFTGSDWLYRALVTVTMPAVKDNSLNPTIAKDYLSSSKGTRNLCKR